MLLINVVRSGLYSLPSLFSSSRNKLNKRPKPAHTQAVAVGAVNVSCHPCISWQSPLWAQGHHSCGTCAWPRCDLAQGKTSCCFSPGDSTQAKSRGVPAMVRRVPACPLLLESLKLGSPNHLAGATCHLQRMSKKHLSATCAALCPSSIILCSWHGGSPALAWLQPSNRHSRREMVAAAAGSWGTTRRCTRACSCSARAACLK